MEYNEIKANLISMFDKEKLQQAPSEWGFFNAIQREVRSIGYATNIDPNIIRKAKHMDVDMLLTHHDSWDFVFGLKEKCNELLLEYEMAHAFFHAPLDDADFGTSASLARELGITKAKVDMPYLDIFEVGIIGSISPTTFDQFSSKLTSVLDENVRCYRNNDKPVCKVAVVTGAGNLTGEMQRAVANGCDTYITGEYVLYSQQYAELYNMNLFVGSHTRTEIFGVESMAKLLCEKTDIRLLRVEEPNY